MDKDLDVHRKWKCLAWELKRLDTTDKISERNKELLKKFDKEIAAKELSISRRVFYLNVINKLMVDTKKDFDTLTKDDVLNIIIGINNRRKNNKGYTDYTKIVIRSALKKFIQVIKGYEWNDHKEFPDEVKGITLTSNGKNHKLTAETVLTEEEVRKIIFTTNNVRDRAIIALLYDSGCRVSEILTMERKDVKFINNGMEINVTGKTGQRTIYPLLFALPFVSDWLKAFPNNEIKDNLWVRVKGVWEKKEGKKYKFIRSYTQTPISYSYVRKILIELGAACGIKKPLNPHNLRHSAVTKKYIQGLRGEFCKMYFGWSKNSNMISRYSHLSKEDLYRESEKLYGIPQKEAEKIKSPIKVCQACQERNPEDNNYCSRCGNNLNGDNTSMMERMARLEQLIDKRMETLGKNIEGIR